MMVFGPEVRKTSHTPNTQSPDMFSFFVIQLQTADPILSLAATHKVILTLKSVFNIKKSESPPQFMVTGGRCVDFTIWLVNTIVSLNKCILSLLPDFQILSPTTVNEMSNFIQCAAKISKLGQRCRPTVLQRYESRP